MATKPEDDRLINRLFDGRYLILRRLGSGGMAEVYLAEDQELGRKVALKMLNERHARDEQFVERFKREARNAAGLSHPHIVRIYDRGQAEGTYYIAMEYLDGPTLKELLIRKGPTPPMTAIKFAREILSALAEAHRHEIVHRDIKPHNVIVSPNWQIKVTDFGIARSGASQMTEVGSIVGTAQYLSPEQARGAAVDQRSDLYSLGIVLYEMLTGTVPFTGEAAVEIAMKHLTSVPEPPSKLRPEVPHELDAVVMRALAKDPDQRYASAEEMDADLARVARGAAVSPQTEEAMTQVLAGAGLTSLAAAPTVAQRQLPAAEEAANAYKRPAPYVEPPRRRSLWPRLLWLLAILLAAAGGYLIYNRVDKSLAGSSSVAVEDVQDVAWNNAELLLHQQGLLVRIVRRPSTSIAADLVISQSPGAGTKVAKRSFVTLTVSSGRPQVTIPTIKGVSQTSAVALLDSAGLTPDIHKVNSLSVPAGTVMASAPAQGSVVFKGTTVRINVSAGPKLIAVPSVVSEPYANAASAIEGAGFVPIENTVNSSAPPNQVTGQSPAAGAQEPAGTHVTLTVSKGPQKVAVENVVGDDQADGVQILTQQGFDVTVISENVTDPTQAGLVLKQDPAGGMLKVGSSVTVTVGSLVTPTTATPPVPPPTTTSTPTVTTPTVTTPTVTNSTTTPPPASTTTTAQTTTSSSTSTSTGASVTTTGATTPPPTTTPATATTTTSTTDTTTTGSTTGPATGPTNGSATGSTTTSTP